MVSNLICTFSLQFLLSMRKKINDLFLKKYHCDLTPEWMELITFGRAEKATAKDCHVNHCCIVYLCSPESSKICYKAEISDFILMHRISIRMLYHNQLIDKSRVLGFYTLISIPSQSSTFDVSLVPLDLRVHFSNSSPQLTPLFLCGR